MSSQNKILLLVSAVLTPMVLLLLAACGPRVNTPTPALATKTHTPPVTMAPPSVTPVPQTPTPTATPARSVGLPVFSHIYLIVMENKEYGKIIGSPDAPYLNSLSARYGLATNYTGVAHPSEPNYFASFSGSTQGATNDGVYNLNGENIADQIEAKGKSWQVFAENVPPNCFTGQSATGGADGPGTYARKHNPAISFTDISRSPARCANIIDFTHFDPAAANYALIIPNLCHDMHDCSVTVGDSFLKGLVPKILNSPAWQKDGVLFITWDEGTTNLGGGGRVPLLVISNRVTQGFQSRAVYNHYSLVRTIQDAWGLGCLNESCQANNLAEFFNSR